MQSYEQKRKHNSSRVLKVDNDWRKVLRWRRGVTEPRGLIKELGLHLGAGRVFSRELAKVRVFQSSPYCH